MSYKIYTTKYDEVVRPTDIVDLDVLEVLERDFHTLCPVEGFEPLRERLEKLTVPTESTAVTILIDNSGSMRGSRIRFAVGAAGIISMYLDKLSIPNEVLGFTTTTWKGGKPREDWINEGRSRNPGRLSATRHVIYKAFDEKLSDVRVNMALMMKEGFLKENIDGEAILWATERLRTQGAERQLLLVISDGAPICDSTLAVNEGGAHPLGKCLDDSGPQVYKSEWTQKNCLADHLVEVLSDIREAGDVVVDAIGIGYDVSYFYGSGESIVKLEDLAPAAIRKLEQMLQTP